MTKFKYLILGVTLLIYCSCAVSVPESRIPKQAWRPGDVALVKQPIYIEKSVAGLMLVMPRNIALGRKLNDNELSYFDILGTLKPGDKLRVLRCINHTGSTTGGTHLELKVISGAMSGNVVLNGAVMSRSIVDSDGEVFAIPDSDVLERVAE